MNVYFIVNQREITDKVQDDCEIYHWETFKPCEVVFARSRAHARHLFTRHFDLDYIEPLVMTTVEKDVDRKPGIAPVSDPYWAMMFGWENVP